MPYHMQRTMQNSCPKNLTMNVLKQNCPNAASPGSFKTFSKWKGGFSKWEDLIAMSYER